ncbi:uncharacterized protein BDV14DRAFT_177675 [Aspergillus stella-maris]|uniref:uncharacterized protein n=1 Tax=Aspergillus stella-maris TaxID=1810926 RepID=UPI003CCE03BE
MSYDMVVCTLCLICKSRFIRAYDCPSILSPAPALALLNNPHEQGRQSSSSSVPIQHFCLYGVSIRESHFVGLSIYLYLEQLLVSLYAVSTCRMVYVGAFNYVSS